MQTVRDLLLRSVYGDHSPRTILKQCLYLPSTLVWVGRSWFDYDLSRLENREGCIRELILVRQYQLHQREIEIMRDHCMHLDAYQQ